MYLDVCSSFFAHVQLTVAVDDAAVWTSARIIADLDASFRQTNKITFNEFAEWYTSGGFKSFSFLELLDLRKVRQQHRL